MQPDEPMAHMPYTPLGQDNSHDKAEARQEVYEQTPVLRTVMDHFIKRIDELNSVTTIPNDVLKDTDRFMHTVESRKIAILAYQNEIRYLQNKVDALLSN